MESFDAEAKKRFQISLTHDQLDMFDRYEHLLIDWNTRYNLTALYTHDDIRRKHFLDSLACTLAWNGNLIPRKIIDVGTGAGFPGLVLKIVFPKLKLTLADSVGKKLEFCQMMVETLDLPEVEIINARAETIGQNPQYREQFDCAVARAVASLSVLSEYLLPLVHVNGEILALKGEKGQAEIIDARKSIQVMGGGIPKVFPYFLPDETHERILIALTKMSASPPQYPRFSGIPIKNPLV